MEQLSVLGQIRGYLRIHQGLQLQDQLMIDVQHFLLRIGSIQIKRVVMKQKSEVSSLYLISH